MSREIEASTPVSRWETALLTLFILGALWAGYVLMDKRTGKDAQHAAAHQPVAEEASEAPTHTASNEGAAEEAEEDEAALPEAEKPADFTASIQHWGERQAQLTQLVKKAVHRPIELAYVFSLFPQRLNAMESFENFTIEHGLPMPGAVYSAAHGPVCIDFRWTPVPFADATYTLEIAKTRDFAHYRSFGSQTNGVHVQIRNGADYFWRIRSTRDREQVVSGIQGFLVTSPPETAEQKRIRALATRVRDESASLADLQYCL
ncbi:hypothetical protein K2X33_06250 [bacterium]|nr:hypothetical protein [bacterium]